MRLLDYATVYAFYFEIRSGAYKDEISCPKSKLSSGAICGIVIGSMIGSQWFRLSKHRAGSRYSLLILCIYSLYSDHPHRVCFMLHKEDTVKGQKDFCQ